MNVITYALTHKGITYGWHNKKLYRLPCKIGLRYYCLKKLTLVPIGRKFGYRLSQKAFTTDQLKQMTCLLIEPYYFTEITHKDLP